MVEVCNTNLDEMVDSFAEQNRQEGLRVFVAGGSRPGTDPVYVEEAYNLGRQIIKWTSNLTLVCPIPASWAPLPAASWTVGTKAVQGQGISDSGRDHAGLF